MTTGIVAQEAVPSSREDPAPVTATPPSPAKDAPKDSPKLDLPVSVDRIRKALEETPTQSLLRLRETPTFRIEVQERNKLQELISTLDFRGGPTPAGGVYAAEMQRLMFPSVDNPLRQPYAEFSQPELLTIIIENIVRKYLGGRALSAITSAQREAAEEAARAELRQAIGQYCAAQPNSGAGIAICTNRDQ